MADENNNTGNLPAEIPDEIARIARPVIRNLPKQNRAQVAGVIQQISRFHSGPLPDAETLRGYAEIIPDGAERIMVLVEKEASHRHEQEERIVHCNTVLARRGQWMGLGLTLLLGGAGTLLGMNGHDLLAGTVFTSTIVAVVTVFVLGRKYGPPTPTQPDPPTVGKK